MGGFESRHDLRHADQLILDHGDLRVRHVIAAHEHAERPALNFEPGMAKMVATDRDMRASPHSLCPRVASLTLALAPGDPFAVASKMGDFW